MKLSKLEIENFRGYQKTVVNFEDNLTTIIGLNDVGKSTILEALDIFFNDKKAISSIDFHDFRKGIGSGDIKITCYFSGAENLSVTLDISSQTTLKEEFLLEENEDLCISKIFSVDVENEKIKPCQTFINCLHFQEKSKCYLLPAKKNKALKDTFLEILKENNIDLKKDKEALQNFIISYGLEEVKQNNNSDLRKFIKAYYKEEESHLTKRIIKISELDGGAETGDKKLSEKIMDFLPSFALFKSDRPMNDKEAEIQDPVTQIIKNTLKENQEQLNDLKEAIKKQAQDLAQKTIEKMGDINPDLAKSLISEFETDDFSKGLKITIKDDKGIPLNKRGSGVRRLLLFSFFRAEAEEQAKKTNKRNIIYAVEEVETSQNPKAQKEIIKSLHDLTYNNPNQQIIITTHSPELAGEVNIKTLRYIKKDKENDLQKVVELEKDQTDEQLLKTITDELGVFGDVILSSSKVIFACEGKSDPVYLKHFLDEIKKEDNKYLKIEIGKNVQFLPCGGDNLRHLVNKKYLEILDQKKFLLVDRDIQEYINLVEKINLDDKNRNKFKGRVLNLYTIENYFKDCLADLEFAKWKINQEFKTQLNNFDLTGKKLVNLVSNSLYNENPLNSHKPKEDCIKAKLEKNVSKIKIENFRDEAKEWFDVILEMLEN